MFNAVRNLGGSLALAGISIVQDQRLWFHSRRLEESMHANSVAVQDYVHSLGGGTAAMLKVEQQIQGQALVMTYNDIFWMMGLGTMVVLPLVLFPGAGSELYRGLGAVVLAGLVVSTVFTLFLIPTMFTLTRDTQRALWAMAFGRPKA